MIEKGTPGRLAAETESADPGRVPSQLTRHLMVTGLGLWGLGIGGALAPRAVRLVLYPNYAEAPRFDLVSPAPIGAPVLWAALVVWCVTWAFVAEYTGAAWAAQHGRHPGGAPALLLLSLASTVVFGLAVSALPRLATRDSYRGDDAIPFLAAFALQLLVSWSYSALVGLRPLSVLPRAEGDWPRLPPRDVTCELPPRRPS